MRILVIGTGGREHAIVTKLATDSEVSELHAAPGSAAMAGQATVHPELQDASDPDQVVELAQQVAADLAVVGPEAPLVAGVADALRAAGFAVFGPGKEAAQIEGSKAFAKDVMAAAGVNTARAEHLAPGASAEEIDAALDRFGPHFVVKDDGLAGGKGVVVTDDRAEAIEHVQAVHAAGNPVLLESFLSGPEISLFCLVDGEDVVPLLPAQDHKRAHDNDAGPNTGGMGAYAPLTWLPEGGVQRIVDEVCRPVAQEMARRGTPYSGLLYAGLAWGEDGPAVVEFNCRFGDPETQAVLSLLKSSLAEALYATATGKLAELAPLEWEDAFAVMVVLAAGGYPASPRKGDALTGAALDDASRVLHAGTRKEGDTYYSAGGRVLGVVGKGESIDAARAAVYEVLDGIELPGGFYRTDIAKKAAAGEIRV